MADGAASPGADHLFCFGLGYTAGVLARRLRNRGAAISGTARSEDGAARLRQRGYAGHVFDGKTRHDSIADALQTATHVLLSVPPGANGDPAFRAYAEEITRSPSVRWIGYLSTVGVYGDASGAWVDETTPAVPGSERGKRRLNAEHDWQALGEASGKSVFVFRLPGIYGPGRSAIDDCVAGTARSIIKPGQVFNRIHVDDIATALEASFALTGTGTSAERIFNVTDDEPGPPQDVVNFAADLLSLPRPPSYDFATANLTDMARSFYSENKRVSNARMKAMLGVTLAYPTFRDGLRAIAARRN